MIGEGLKRRRPVLRPIPLWAAAPALVGFVFIAFAPAIFNDGDTSWHLAAGRLILASHNVPTADPFSFTAAGQPWVAHEWLAEVLMASAYLLGGWSGLALLSASAFAALLLLLGYEAGRWLGGRRALIALIVVAIGLTPFILARPHMLAWPLLARWTILLLRAREADRPPPLAASLLMFVWANLHGSFLFGFLLLGLFGLEALVESADRRKVLFGWGSFAVASFVLALLNPQGFHIFLYPIELSAMKSLAQIMEWRPTVASDQPGFALALFAALAVLLGRGAKVPPVRLLVLGIMLWLALAHIRHQAVLLIVGSLILAKPLGESFGTSTEASPAPRAKLWWLGVAAFVAAGLRLALPAERHESVSNPVTAIAHIPPRLRGTPMLNAYGFGGPLILDGYRVFIDGRNDLYGDPAMADYDRIAHGDMRAFAQSVQRWRIGWTILEPDMPLVRALDGAGWRRIYGDQYAVIHEAPLDGSAQ